MIFCGALRTRFPRAGGSAFFDRSYYEDALEVLAGPQLLAAQRLRADRLRPAIWKERFEDINAFDGISGGTAP